MEQDFFTSLPSEIILNILSRLPTETTMSCKCVCKPWLNLLSTPEFVKSHLSKSATRLAVYEFGKYSNPDLKPYKIVELVNQNRWKTVLEFDPPFEEPVHSSANGVLFLGLGGSVINPLILCNPITREYITLSSILQPSSKLKFKDWYFKLITYGFGVSKMSQEYKVVRIFYRTSPPHSCQVYTVGTGSWRKIPIRRLTYVRDTKGAFLNGNLHWLVKKGSSRLISCLDLETELFTSFPLHPHLDDEGAFKCDRNVSVLGDCLSLCEIKDLRCEFEIGIWLMKEYGDETSWMKEFVVRMAEFPAHLVEDLCPIKVFEDGDILMEWGGTRLLYHSSKSNTNREVCKRGMDRPIFCTTASFAPSFLPLKTFVKENVSSF